MSYAIFVLNRLCKILSLVFEPEGVIQLFQMNLGTVLQTLVVITSHVAFCDKIYVYGQSACSFLNIQWLKCNGTQGNAVPPPPIYGSKRSPTSDCNNARERHTTIVRDPNLNVAFPHL